MEVTEDKQGSVLAVALKGRLDAVTSKAVEERILKLIDGGETRLVVDLAQLEFVSSIGLRVLMLAAKRLKAVNGKIAVCALQPPIKKVFDIAGFTALFPTFATREEAVKGIA